MSREYKSTYRKRRSKKPFTLKDVKLRMTDAMKEMEKIVLDGDVDWEKANTKIQAVNALSGLSSRYSKVIEATDLKEELEEIKELIERQDRI